MTLEAGITALIMNVIRTLPLISTASFAVGCRNPVI
jgi:hypothetical protein